MNRVCISELARMLKNKELSAHELTCKYLDTIARRDGEIGAFITVTGEAALARARLTDQKIKNGEPLGLLEGIPFAVKDNICVKGMRTTCGSRMLENFISPYTATAVERLLTQGAIVLGKTNMDEFAMGSATDTSFFGVTKNPLDTSYTAGGSSGGSAAALVSDMCAFSLGSDTGGSARQPASFCGLVSMKPTYGTVSRYGLVAYASSLEQICPITHTVKDNALLLQSMCGQDRYDATTVERSADLIPDSCDVKELKVGLPLDVLDGVAPDVRHTVLCAADALKRRGAQILEIELPNTDVALAAYYVISSAEASSNLSRYDGVRYGHAYSGAESIDELFTRSRSEGFGDEVKRRLLLGTFCLSFEGRDAYYKKALQAKAELICNFNTLFEECDVILMPVAPTAAYKFENKPSNSLDVWREDCFCVFANLTGCPSLTVPFGENGDRMPVGLQLMGKLRAEKELYGVGYALEKERCGE